MRIGTKAQLEEPLQPEPQNEWQAKVASHYGEWW